MNKIGVACVILDGGGVWLSKRLGAYETGKYAFPGGMVEDNDISYAHAIQREMEEETGLCVDIGRFERSIDCYHSGGKSDVTCWFILRLRDGEVLVNKEPHKHSDWELYNLQDAVKLNLMLSTGEILNKIMNINVKNYTVIDIKGVKHELTHDEAHELYIQLRKSLNITDNKEFVPYNPWIQPFGTPVPTTKPFPYDVWYSDKTNMINGPINLRTTGSMYKNNTNFKL